MDPSPNIYRIPHYHIRWSNRSLDWQAFKTPEDAQIRAEELRIIGEAYAIERFEPPCNRCLRFTAAIAS